MKDAFGVKCDQFSEVEGINDDLQRSMISTMQKKAKKRRGKSTAETKVIEEFKERKQRRWEGRPNNMMLTWGRMLQSERVTDPTDGKGGKLLDRKSVV